MTTPDRYEFMERDLQNHAKSLSALTEKMTEYEKIQAIKAVTDVYIEARLKRIENLGWWILFTFGATFISVASTFVLRGGLFIGK